MKKADGSLVTVKFGKKPEGHEGGRAAWALVIPPPAGHGAPGSSRVS